jgi:hypothetical protein
MEIDRMTIELVRWIRERAGEEIRYRRTLRELRRIDERTLDDRPSAGQTCPRSRAGTPAAPPDRTATSSRQPRDHRSS